MLEKCLMRTARVLVVAGLLQVACQEKPIIKTRAETIPTDVVKQTPQLDFSPHRFSRV